MAWRDIGTILRRTDFRALLWTRLTGQFADGLLQASLATFVLFSPERQTTPQAVAASFAILLLPYSLIGPFAGILLDRWRRRNVLVRANLLRALSMGTPLPGSSWSAMFIPVIAWIIGITAVAVPLAGSRYRKL